MSLNLLSLTFLSPVKFIEDILVLFPLFISIKRSTVLSSIFLIFAVISLELKPAELYRLSLSPGSFGCFFRWLYRAIYRPPAQAVRVILYVTGKMARTEVITLLLWGEGTRRL